MASAFIKATELWLPTGDGSLLALRGSAFGSAKRFESLSRSMCSGRGQGLPGRMWDAGKLVLMRDFTGADFCRADAARPAGQCAAATGGTHRTLSRRRNPHLGAL